MTCCRSRNKPAGDKMSKQPKFVSRAKKSYVTEANEGSLRPCSSLLLILDLVCTLSSPISVSYLSLCPLSLLLPTLFYLTLAFSIFEPMKVFRRRKSQSNVGLPSPHNISIPPPMPNPLKDSPGTPYQETTPLYERFASKGPVYIPPPFLGDDGRSMGPGAQKTMREREEREALAIKLAREARQLDNPLFDDGGPVQNVVVAPPGSDARVNRPISGPTTIMPREPRSSVSQAYGGAAQVTPRHSSLNLDSKPLPDPTAQQGEPYALLVFRGIE